jgi:hypothetical protein
MVNIQKHDNCNTYSVIYFSNCYSYVSKQIVGTKLINIIFVISLYFIINNFYLVRE